jgi:hypothetical protein
MNQADGAPSTGQPITTVSHDGRFWHVFLEFAEHLQPGDRYRALLAFTPADQGESEGTLRTIPLLIEDSYEEVVRRARALDAVQLSAFLRSLLP